MLKRQKTKIPLGHKALWFGLGAIFQILITLVIGLFLIRDDELGAAASSAISAFASLGLLAVALWAGVVGVKTMHASKDASDAAKAASVEAEKSTVLQAASNRAAEESNHQAKTDSKNANRPYVGASIEPSIRGDTVFDLVVRNYGRSVAKNVTIELKEDPKPKDAIVRSLLEMFETPRSLMPAQSLRAMWRAVPAIGTKFVADGPDATNGTHRDKELGMPESAYLTVKYQDAEGEKYTESIEVMSDRSGQWPVPGVGADSPRVLTPKHFYELGQVIAKHIGLNRY